MLQATDGNRLILDAQVRQHAGPGCRPVAAPAAALMRPRQLL